ncbi:MAG: FHA domain-containing protein [Chloroflexota bacterium]|nr:MAG: FHA domain-containing protein [Chloroflexota bacterium]
MNAPSCFRRNCLILTSVVALLLLASLGPVLAQAEPRLEITTVDTGEFPDIRVLVLATDGESQRQPGLERLTLRENDTLVDEFEVTESPVGIELFIVIDANSDIEAHDDAGGPSRREKVRDSIIHFAEDHMDGSQLDRVTIIVPEGETPAVLLDRAVFPNEVINEINFFDKDAAPNSPVGEMLSLAIERATSTEEEGRFQAVLLYSDAGRLDRQLDYAALIEQAQAIDIPIFAAILGSRADDFEIANITALTEPTRGNWVHMPQPEEIAPLFETLTSNRPQFELSYRSALATSGHRSIVAEQDGVQTTAEAALEIAPPAAEIVVDNSRPIRRVAPEPGAPLVEADPGSQPIVAQVSWPDGYPRTVMEAVLLVNGAPHPAKAAPAVDDGGLLALEWDISSLDEGSYDLTVRVVDELGLEGQSAPLPMTVIVEGLAPEESLVEITPTALPAGEEESTSGSLEANVSLIAIGVAVLAFLVAVVVLIVAVVLLRRRKSGPPAETAPPPAEPTPSVDHQATQVIKPAFVAQQATTAYLEPLENAPDHQGTIAIGEETMTIGRDPKLAQIVFADKSVSRLHARIMQSDNSFRLYDEGSASGTYINFEQIGLTPQVLNDNDDIHIGRVHLRFHVSAVGDDADSTQIMPAPRPTGAQPDEVDDGMSTEPYMPQQPGQYQSPPAAADDDEDDISTQPYLPHQPQR